MTYVGYLVTHLGYVVTYVGCLWNDVDRVQVGVRFAAARVLAPDL